MRTTQTTIGALLALCVFNGATAATAHAQGGSTKTDGLDRTVLPPASPQFRGKIGVNRGRTRITLCPNGRVRA
jgi:hypothetical protein